MAVLDYSGLQRFWSKVKTYIGEHETKVKQNNSATSAAYRVLLSWNATNTTELAEAKKSGNLTYNPSTKELVTGGTVNGFTLAAASAKGVDMALALGSDSANLPVSAAVAELINDCNLIVVSVAATSETSVSIMDPGITADHIVLNATVNHGINVTWTTTSGELDLACSSGIPAMTLYLARKRYEAGE